MPGALKVTIDKTNDLAEALRLLADTNVLVGIPTENNERTDSPIGNASIGYINENGSPAQGIPPRPFLEPGVRGSVDQWSAALAEAAKAALDGNPAAVERGFYKAGIIAVSAVKSGIAAGIPPPLKEATVRARRRRSAGSAYRRKATRPEDVTPLIDSGQLINSITFVVRKSRR